MAKEPSQNVRGGYQIDEFTYAKGGVVLNAYMCAQGEMWKGSKIGHKIHTY